jgi:uncharacterized membrane protein
MKKNEIKDVFFPTELSDDASLAIEFDVKGTPCIIKLYPKDIMRMQKIIHSNTKIMREKVELANRRRSL